MRLKEMQELIVLQGVKHIRKTLPRCGLKKLHYKLRNFMKMHAIKMGRDKLADLLRTHNLLIKKQKGPKTTNSIKNRNINIGNNSNIGSNRNGCIAALLHCCAATLLLQYAAARSASPSHAAPKEGAAAILHSNR